MDLQSILDGLRDAAPYVLGLVAAATLFAEAFQRLALAFERWAYTTAWEWDDSVARYLVIAARGLLDALAFVSRFLPRLTAGRVPQ